MRYNFPFICWDCWKATAHHFGQVRQAFQIIGFIRSAQPYLRTLDLLIVTSYFTITWHCFVIFLPLSSFSNCVTLSPLLSFYPVTTALKTIQTMIPRWYADARHCRTLWFHVANTTTLLYGLVLFQFSVPDQNLHNPSCCASEYQIYEMFVSRIQLFWPKN